MLHVASWGIEASFSQSMTNTSASDGNQSQEGDKGLHVVWKLINSNNNQSKIYLVVGNNTSTIIGVIEY